MKKCIAMSLVLSLMPIFSEEEHKYSDIGVEMVQEKIVKQERVEAPEFEATIGDTGEKIKIRGGVQPDVEIFSIKITSSATKETLWSFGYCYTSKYYPTISVETTNSDLKLNISHGASGLSAKLHYVCHRIGDNEALTLLVSADPSLKIVASWRSPAVDTPLGASGARLESIGENQYKWVRPK